MKKNKMLLTAFAVPALGCLAAPLVFLTGCSKVTKADKQVINNINKKINGLGLKTMHQVVTYLKADNIDIEQAELSKENQLVWDSDANVVISINEENSLTYGPKGYSLNSNRNHLWKMVSFGQANSTLNAKVEQFQETSEFGQYIRSSETVASSITFSSSIDVGGHEDITLVYEPNANFTCPKVVTNNSNLNVKGSVSDIDHYGHAHFITVTEMATGHTYNEYGSVDGNIFLQKGELKAQPGCEVNAIVVESNETKVTIEKDSETEITGYIGSVGKTAEVTIDFSEIVDDSKAEEEFKPDYASDPVVIDRYVAGTGTKNSPYIISTPKQLVYCSEDVNSNTLSKDKTMHFALLNNIDMQNIAFTPIGKTNAFFGTFDGNGYTISNLSIVSDSEYCGLFGFTNGEVKGDFKSESSIWDIEKHEMKEGVIVEDNYSTVIKNVTLSSVNITNLNNKHTGALIGDAVNTYISNVNVESGTVHGYKCVGGIVGDLESSIITNSTTGTNLTVKTTTGYNIGGIVGTDGYQKMTEFGSAVLNCVNNAPIECNTSATGGNVGGIIGMGQNNQVCTMVNNCMNKGNITSTSSTGGKANDVGGISGNSNSIIVIANSNNEGEITTNGQNVKYISGITYYGAPHIYNCKNTADISADADYMAGILAWNENSAQGGLNIMSCVNEGTLKNTTITGGITSDIAAGVREMTLENATFENVAALNNALSSRPDIAISLVLKNVVVQNTADVPLCIPTKMNSISSNLKVADTITINSNTVGTRIDLNLPETNITIDTDCSNLYLKQMGDNSTITIESNGKVNCALVSGANSQIINKGTIVNQLGLNGSASYAENNGTCGNVTFGGNGVGETGSGDKEFVNRGTVHRESYTENNHVIDASITDSTCNITINNYGTIKYEDKDPTHERARGYLFCLYNPGTKIINNYSGSELNTNITDGYVFAVQNTPAQLKYASDATFIIGGQSKDWTKLSFNNVVISPLE